MHHYDLHDSVETICLRKIKLNAKMLSANQIAGFLNFSISKTIGGIKFIFYMEVPIC